MTTTSEESRTEEVDVNTEGVRMTKPDGAGREAHEVTLEEALGEKDLVMLSFSQPIQLQVVVQRSGSGARVVATCGRVQEAKYMPLDSRLTVAVYLVVLDWVRGAELDLAERISDGMMECFDLQREPLWADEGYE